MVEIVLRFVSAVSVTVAAVLLTQAVRWAAPIWRPAFKYAAGLMWVLAAYRIGLAVSFFEGGGTLGAIIRGWINVAFILVSVAFALFAEAARQARGRLWK